MPRKTMEETKEEVAGPTLRRSTRSITAALSDSNITLRKRTSSKDSQPGDVEAPAAAAIFTRSRRRSTLVEEEDEKPKPTRQVAKRRTSTTPSEVEEPETKTQKKSPVEESKPAPVRTRRRSSVTSEEPVPERTMRTRRMSTEIEKDPEAFINKPMTRSRRASIDKILDTPEKVPVKPKPRRRISTTEDLEPIEEQREVKETSDEEVNSIKLTPFKKISENVVANDLNLSTIQEAEPNVDEDINKSTSLRKSPRLNKSVESKEISPRKLDFEETTTLSQNSQKSPDSKLKRSSLSLRKSTTPKKSPVIVVVNQPEDVIEEQKLEVAAVLESNVVEALKPVEEPEQDSMDPKEDALLIIEDITLKEPEEDSPCQENDKVSCCSTDFELIINEESLTEVNKSPGVPKSNEEITEDELLDVDDENDTETDIIFNEIELLRDEVSDAEDKTPTSNAEKIQLDVEKTSDTEISSAPAPNDEEENQLNNSKLSKASMEEQTCEINEDGKQAPNKDTTEEVEDEPQQPIRVDTSVVVLEQEDEETEEPINTSKVDDSNKIAKKVKKSLTPTKLNQRKSTENLSTGDGIKEPSELTDSLDNNKMKDDSNKENKLLRKKSTTPVKLSEQKSNVIEYEAIEKLDTTSKQLSDSFSSKKTEQVEENNKSSLEQLRSPVVQNLSVAVKKVMNRMDKLEEYTSTRLDEFLASKEANDILEQNEESESDQSDSFVLNMAEEGEESTPSEDSNDIIDVGEAINTTDSEVDESGNEYSIDSFVCDDDERFDLLSGEDELMGEEKKRKRRRIISVSDSSDSNFSLLDDETVSEFKNVVKDLKAYEGMEKKKAKKISEVEVNESPLKDNKDEAKEILQVKVKKSPLQDNNEAKEIVELEAKKSPLKDTKPSRKSKTRNNKTQKSALPKPSSLDDSKEISEVEVNKSPLKGNNNESKEILELEPKKSPLNDTKPSRKSKTRNKKARKSKKLTPSSLDDWNEISQVEVNKSPLKDNNDEAKKILGVEVNGSPLKATKPSPLVETKARKRKFKTKDEKAEKSKKPKLSSLDDLKDGTFNIMNQLINEGKKKRPVRVVKPSVVGHSSSWTTEESLVKPSTSLQSRAAPKATVKKPSIFHAKDFKNQMLYNAGRVRRVDTKTLLQKRGAYF